LDILRECKRIENQDQYDDGNDGEERGLAAVGSSTVSLVRRVKVERQVRPAVLSAKSVLPWAGENVVPSLFVKNSVIALDAFLGVDFHEALGSDRPTFVIF
jgi:hypothetical protein